jgi:hypothetical protein
VNEDPDSPPSALGPEAESAGPERPSQEELRERLEQQLRDLRVEDLMVESAVSLLNLTARRIAKEDERDLGQARAGIDAVRAWVDLLPEEAAKQIRNALSELQVLYAQASEEAGAREAGAGEPEGETPQAERGGDEGAPSPKPPRRPGEPPPRLWTPPGST